MGSSSTNRVYSVMGGVVSPASWARLRRFSKTWQCRAGFIVLVGLALLGEQVFLALHTGSQMSVANPNGVKTVKGKLDLALKQALGKSDRGVRRFRVSVKRISAAPTALVVTVHWSINADVSTGSVGNGAEADAYLIFGHVYSLNLPIKRVNLVGTFPVGHPVQDRPVMKLWLGRNTAKVVGRDGWGTLDAETLWPLIHRSYVSPDFQPISTE